MRKILYIFAAGTLAAVMAAPVFAQTDSGAAGSQAMQAPSEGGGKTVIEAGGASTADLNAARYKAWDEFQTSHPNIARELRHNPRLVRKSSFVDRHAELKELFESNAGMRQDMMRNPGNYLARMSSKRHHHHHGASAG